MTEPGSLDLDSFDLDLECKALVSKSSCILNAAPHDKIALGSVFLSFWHRLWEIFPGAAFGRVRTLGVVGAWEFVEQQAAADQLSGFQVPRCFLGAAQVLSSRSGEQPSSRLPGYQPGSPPRSFIGILDTKLSLGQLLNWCSCGWHPWLANCKSRVPSRKIWTIENVLQ